MREQRTKVKRRQPMLSEQEYYKLWHQAKGETFRDSSVDADSEFWKLIVPYLREDFPREAIKEVVCILLGYDVTSHLPEIDQAIDKIERLCNGGSARIEPTHPNGSNCPNPNNEGLCGCKPCPTCEGTKMVDANYSSGYGGIRTKPPQTPCPDCSTISLHQQTLAEVPDEIRERVRKEGDQCKGQRRVQTDRRGPIHLRHNFEYLRRLRIRRKGDERRK